MLGVRVRSLLLLVLVASGCVGVRDATGPARDDAPGDYGATYADPGRYVYVLDDDAGALDRYDPATGALVSLPLGATPGRMARMGDTIWVTLPAERGIAVVAEDDAGLERVGTLATGAEPLGIAVDDAGARLYVALATEGKVAELATDDGEVLRSWAVDGQPSWLALGPEALYVGSAYEGVLSSIDLAAGTVSTVDLPEVKMDRDTRGKLTLTRRITGDLAVSPDGTLLAVPLLLVDNDTSVNPPTTPEEPEDGGGYASENTSQASRFNPVVALVTIEAGGQPDADSTTFDLVTGTSHSAVVRSYLSSVAFAPDDDVVFASMEASGAVIAVSYFLPFGSVSNAEGLTVAQSVTLETSDASPRPISGAAPSIENTGPRRVAFADDGRLYADCFLARRIASIPIDRALSGSGRGGGQTMDATVDLPASALDPDVQAGRTLFFSAIDQGMVASGAGVSCSTCHHQGRNDGLTWDLEDQGLRQTPSLAGGIAATAPFTWSGGVASVDDEVVITSEGRMGGEGLTEAQIGQVAAYVESIRAPDVPALGSTAAAVERGRALFERSDVGCASCHTGELYTDNQTYSLFGEDAVNTPSLRRVSTTAPYLHDGEVPTLRALLERVADGSMGDTSGLSESDLDDLEAFLKSI